MTISVIFFTSFDLKIHHLQRVADSSLETANLLLMTGHQILPVSSIQNICHDFKNLCKTLFSEILDHIQKSAILTIQRWKNELTGNESFQSASPLKMVEPAIHAMAACAVFNNGINKDVSASSPPCSAQSPCGPNRLWQALL